MVSYLFFKEMPKASLTEARLICLLTHGAVQHQGTCLQTWMGWIIL